MLNENWIKHVAYELGAKLREVTKLLEAERAHVADQNETIRKFRSAVVDQKGNVDWEDFWDYYDSY